MTPGKPACPRPRSKELLPNLEDALEWLRDHGDLDGDGFLEYLDASGHGLVNQGWKDSGDAIRWHDGSLAKGPIALAEVQAYAYEAAVVGAEILDAFGRRAATEWRDYAAGMAERFRRSSGARTSWVRTPPSPWTPTSARWTA